MTPFDCAYKEKYVSFGEAALTTIESPAIIGIGAKKSNKNELLVPTVNAVDVSKFGILVFETADTLQLL
jgi:hypothetical protein